MIKMEPYQTHMHEQVIEESARASHLGSDRFFEIILMVSLFFVVISVAMIIQMCITRVMNNRQSHSEKALRERYQSFLSSFLLLPIDESFIGIQQNHQSNQGLELLDLQSRNRREILAEEIYELLKNIDGLQRVQLINYFLGIGLQNEVEKWLTSKNYQKTIKAINMIACAELVGYSDHLRGHVNHDNHDISIAATVALIQLEKNLDSLLLITRKLNDWDCHKIYEVVNNDPSLSVQFFHIMKKESLQFQSNLLAMKSFLANHSSLQYN